jgi:Tfp pilus assembly protein PilF
MNSRSREGNLVDAEREFHEALGSRPDYSDTHANLGFALAQRGKLEVAVRLEPGTERFQRALDSLRRINAQPQPD